MGNRLGSADAFQIRRHLRGLRPRARGDERGGGVRPARAEDVLLGDAAAGGRIGRSHRHGDRRERGRERGGGRRFNR